MFRFPFGKERPCDLGPRKHVFLHAAMTRVTSDRQVPICVRNLGEGGLMAECRQTCRVGEVVTVDLRGCNCARGRIVWANSQRIGVQFDEPFDVSCVLAWKQEMPAHYTPPVSPRAWRPAMRLH